ncbi:MAG: MerC domain-containing protein [Coraliomargarita sp.]
MENASTKDAPQRLLDKLAIGLAGVCAVHCLLTPVLVVLLPIVATSFFVHKDFHLWMLFGVLPTTTFAVFMGCRKHKDRWVVLCSLVGLSLLVSVVVSERIRNASHGAGVNGEPHCEDCARDLSESPLPLKKAAWINTLGGVFLVGAHVRNFRLCRRQKCCHNH